MPIVTTPPSQDNTPPKQQQTSDKQTSPPAFAFNRTAVAQKLQALTDRMNSFIGKKNTNAFLWVKENLEPLIKQFQKGPHTQEFQDKVLSIPGDVVPVVNPEQPVEEKKQVDESSAGPRNEAPKLTPQGLNIPQK